MNEFIKQLDTNPRGTGFNVGDTVDWVNDYGVKWRHQVIGFNYTSHMAAKYGCTVYLNTDSYWFPYNPGKLKKSNS